MFRVIYYYLGERYSTLVDYSTIEEAVAVCQEFRLNGFSAHVEQIRTPIFA